MNPTFPGTAQVVTYGRNAYCQLRLTSGERILVSFANQPSPSVRITRQRLGGLIPGPIVWQYTATMAGGYQAYVRNLITMFADSQTPQEPLDAVCTALSFCNSIAEVVRELLRRGESLRG